MFCGRSLFVGGRPPLCLHNAEKPPFKPQHENRETKGRRTRPKRPFFFRLLHSFAVRLQRIGMQRETTTRPIFKSKGDYLLKIGKYHAFRKMPRANRAACVWFESTPPPFKKPPPPVATWLLCGKIVHVSISPRRRIGVNTEITPVSPVITAVSPVITGVISETTAVSPKQPKNNQNAPPE